MAELNEIVGAMLRDIAQSQDAANRYSATLAREYQADPILSALSVPNALLTEVELEVKYAVKEVQDAGARPEHHLAAACAAIEQAAPRAARVAADQTRGTLDQLTKLAQATLRSGDVDSDAQLRAEAVQRNLGRESFLQELGGRIRDRLMAVRDRLFAPDRSLDGQKLKAAILQALDAELLTHPELTDLFGEGKPARGQLLNSLDRSLTPVVTAAAQSAQQHAKAEPVNPARKLELLVGAEALSGVPDRALSTVRIKAQLRNFKWAVVAQTGGVTDRELLPT